LAPYADTEKMDMLTELPPKQGHPVKKNFEQQISQAWLTFEVDLLLNIF
jgi:hypothetical protein